MNKPHPKLLTYIQLLESNNEQLVFALKKCFDLLAVVH